MWLESQRAFLTHADSGDLTARGGCSLPLSAVTTPHLAPAAHRHSSKHGPVTAILWPVRLTTSTRRGVRGGVKKPEMREGVEVSSPQGRGISVRKGGKRHRSPHPRQSV